MRRTACSALDRLRELRETGELGELCEGLYRDHGLLPRFQVSPAAQPPDLDQFLADRGYEVLGITKVCIAAVEDVLRRLRP